MRCATCGRVSSEGAVFCESCGNRLGTPQHGMTSAPLVSIEPVKNETRAPMAALILGIVILAIGVIIYVLAVSNGIHSISHTDPNDPFGTMNDTTVDVGLIFAGYAVMAVGGILAFAGFFLLVVKST